MHQYPDELQKLIAALRRLPGVGMKTAERYAFALLSSPSESLHELSHLLLNLKEKVPHCHSCGSMLCKGTCSFCNNPDRNPSQLCIVATAKDVFPLEHTGEYQGLYHVLGGLLSPLDNIGPNALTFLQLKNRLSTESIKEVVIALDSTLEGDTTALFLKKELSHLPLNISRLAFGIPIGSSLEYVDGSTLALAFHGRRSF